MNANDAMKLEVNEARLTLEIDTLASFSADDPPAVTRIVFSEQDQQARAWLKTRCLEAGLDVREDAVGNTFARWIGAKPDLPAVGTGSHIDAIPHAGKYDGVVGDSRPSAHYNAPGSYRGALSNCFSSLRKSRPGLASAVSVVGCSQARSRLRSMRRFATAMAKPLRSFGSKPASPAHSQASVFLRATTLPLLNCISSRDRSWRVIAFRSAWSRALPRLPAFAFR
jgi:hypothetical protein